MGAGFRAASILRTPPGRERSKGQRALTGAWGPLFILLCACMVLAGHSVLWLVAVGEWLHRGNCMFVGTDDPPRRLNRRENIATIISKIRRRAVIRLVTSTPKIGVSQLSVFVGACLFKSFQPFRLVDVLTVGAKRNWGVWLFGVGELYNNYVGGLVWGIAIATEVIENGISDVRVSSESL